MRSPAPLSLCDINATNEPTNGVTVGRNGVHANRNRALNIVIFTQYRLLVATAGPVSGTASAGGARSLSTPDVVVVLWFAV